MGRFGRCRGDGSGPLLMKCNNGPLTDEDRSNGYLCRCCREGHDLVEDDWQSYCQRCGKPLIQLASGAILVAYRHLPRCECGHPSRPGVHWASGEGHCCPDGCDCYDCQVWVPAVMARSRGEIG